MMPLTPQDANRIVLALQDRLIQIRQAQSNLQRSIEQIIAANRLQQEALDAVIVATTEGLAALRETLLRE